MRALRRGLGVTAPNARRTKNSANKPTGRLTQKIHGHDRYCVNTPPTTGPSKLATAHTTLT